MHSLIIQQHNNEIPKNYKLKTEFYMTLSAIHKHNFINKALKYSQVFQTDGSLKASRTPSQNISLNWLLKHTK